MKAWNQRIWPAVKAVLAIVAIVVLVKVAFFPDRAELPEDAMAGGAISEPTVSPERGTITNDITLTANVRQGEPVDAKATLQGTIAELFVQRGASVVSGQVIANIKQTTPREPVTAADGTVSTPAPAVSYREVTAPATGVVSQLPLIVDQAVSVGDSVAQVTPSTYLVSGTLPPAQLYRLRSQPKEGEVTIAGGPAPFTCTDLAISAGSGAGAQSQAGSTPAPQAGAAGSGSGAAGESTTVRCRVPEGVTVFPGLEANLKIHGGVAENVLTIPVTAVKGQADAGVVTVVAEDGSREVRAVKLGMTDGKRIEVTEGLAELDVILEFVPGAPEPTSSCDPSDPSGCGAPMDGGAVQQGEPGTEGGQGGGSEESRP